ncbi:MAG: hypothetical protein M5R36_09665 [Deltaproteobacteria bacterium]|nr:hypothetical protein [Deltaproteobacteria bacterium]
MRAAAFIAVLLFTSSLAASAFAQGDDFDVVEPDEDDIWGPPRLSAAASIGAFWLAPTVSDARDRRHDNNNDIQGYLRGASLSLRADLARRLEARIGLASSRRSATDFDGDGVNDDPNAGRIVGAIGAAYVAWYVSPAFRVRAGLLPLPWSQWTTKTWGHSYAVSSGARRYGVTESYDLGVLVRGDFPLGLGGYEAAFVNGENDREPETNKGKAGHFVLRVRPLPFGAFRGINLLGSVIHEVQDDPPGDEDHRRTAYSGLLFVPLWLLNFGAEGGVNMITASSSEAPRPSTYASAYVTTDAWRRVALFARADVRDPDIRDEHRRASSFSSFIEGASLRSDEDARLYTFLGGIYGLGGGVYLSPFVTGTFYQEQYGGEYLPPSVAVHLVTTLVF